MEEDKLFHAFGTSSIAIFVVAVMQRLGFKCEHAVVGGIVVAMMVGTIKESADALGFGSPEVVDMGADLIGSFLGSVAGDLFCRSSSPTIIPPK